MNFQSILLNLLPVVFFLLLRFFYKIKKKHIVSKDITEIEKEVELKHYKKKLYIYAIIYSLLLFYNII